MPGAVVNPQQDPTGSTAARLRIGTVQATPAPRADLVWIDVDGTVFPAAYLTGYVPVPGDRVIVSQDDTDWFVLGGKSGYAGNLVLNGDFRQGPHPQLTFQSLPYHWTLYTASGTPSLTLRYLDSDRGDPGLLMSNQSGTAGDNSVYSAPTPCTAGETLYVSSMGVVGLTLAFPTVTLDLKIAWFAKATDTYPNYISETLAATNSISGFATNPFWQFGSGVAPAGATYARAVVRATAAGGSLLYNVGVLYVELNRT